MVSPLQGLRRTLRRHFGFHSLREGQEEVIRSVLAGQDTLAIMPTGAGKSLCYQLPGLQLPGTTVVVTPLLSLMKDQADKLAERGVQAAQVHSQLSTGEEREILEEIGQGKREFVFATPERLAQPEFLALLRENPIDLFVIDEAHCISEWGHDFRPAYLELRHAIAQLGDPPVLALTATATEAVIDDVLQRLGRTEMTVIDLGIWRDNLRFEVVPCSTGVERETHLARLLRDSEGTGLIYTSTVKGCEEITGYLDGLGFEVAAYHGRMSAAERRRNQDRFMAGGLKAMVATNAFGMGIDKQDLRFVIHANLPGSLESYYQEAGRAGRDGKPAHCILLALPEDRNTQLFFIHGSYPKQEHFAAVARGLAKLAAEKAEEAVPLAELQEKSGVAATKTRVILSAFKELGLIEEPERGRFRPVQKLTAAAVAEAAGHYQRKIEGDRQRLDRMTAYSQTALCRWRTLLDYFGEEAEWDRCGNCDNCARPALHLVSVPPPSPDPQRPAAALGLTSLLGRQETAALQAGDAVSLPIYGRGQVQSILADRLTVAFSGGEVREFLRE